MKFRIFSLVYLVVILALAAPAWAADPGPLKVLTVYPSGDVALVRQFTVTFNQPMVPLGDMTLTADQSPVVVKPAFEGTYRWLNVYTLAFEPKTPLEGAVSGEIIVKAETKSLSGVKLDREHRTTYALPAVAVRQTAPAPKASGLPLKPEIHLTFNQPVPLDRLEAMAYIEYGQKQRIGLTVTPDLKSMADRRPGQDFFCMVTPKTELPKDTAFDLVVPSGLPSAVGPQLSTRAFRYPFRTYGPFRILEMVGYRPDDKAPFDPDSGLEIRFTTPVTVKNIKKYLKITPDYDLSRLEDGGEEGLDTQVTNLWLPGPLKAATAYKLTVSGDLVDVFGQKLDGKNVWNVTMGPAQPILDLPGRHGVLEMSKEPTYPFLVRNVGQVAVRGHFLNPDKVIPFIMKHEMYRYLNESGEDFLDGVPRHEIKNASIKITTPPNIATYQPVKLREIFGSNVGLGVLYFDLNAPETNDRANKEIVYRRALVQVTDVGLSVKFGIKNTLIWTTDLRTGQPLGRVRLEIRNTENQTLWRGQSDTQGLAMAPGSETLSIIRMEEGSEKPSLFVLAFHEGQFSLVSTDWNQGIAPWNFGLMSQDLEGGQETMTWVLTALPLYKPGDEVLFKIIRRVAGDRLRRPAEQKIWMQIRDSRGKIIDKSERELTRFGTASGKLTLSPEAPLGPYSVQVGVNPNKMRHAGMFRVEAYRKPTFAVKIKTSSESACVGDKVTADLTATYHFGSPVRGQPAEYVVTATPTPFTLPRFEDYSIEDWSGEHEEMDEPVPTVSKGRLELDDQGRASVTWQTIPARKPRPRTFELETTVTDVDQRTVSQRAGVLVHPASFYLGLKSDNYLVGPGEKVKVKLLAGTPEGKLLTDVSAEVTLSRRVWQTVRRKGVGGYYHYISKAVDTVVERVQVRTEGQPREMTFNLPQGGYYIIAAGSKDDSGRQVASSLDLYAYGPGSTGWEHYDHDRIDLIPDKKEYRPGDSATILIKSPFTQGTGLVTVERMGIKRHQLLSLDGSSPHVKIDLGTEDSPNVYVSVLLVRGRTSEKLDEQGRDVGKPAFKVGCVELKVKDEASRLKVAVKPVKSQYRPGEEVELAVNVTDHQGQPREAEVALIVADAALLQLATEDTYYPERLFFAPRPLAVWTTDLRLNLIGRRHYGLKGAKAGGGGLDPETGKFRKHFVSLAYWEPHVVTDTAGLAKAKFKLPDNLTTFKIFAVAGTDVDQFGTGVDQILVTKPLLINPALPNFAGVGDQFNAAIVLHNQTEATGPALVTISAENVNIQGERAKTFSLGAKSSLEIGFPVQALAGEEAVFRFQVALGEEKDAAEFRIPLRYPNPIITAATYGRITESVSQNIKVPEGADPSRGALTVNMSPSLAGSLSTAFDYLVDYPHPCLEQKTSRAWGDLLSLAWTERLARPAKAADQARNRLNRYLAGLFAFQGDDGGFSFWTASKRPDPYLSAYVLQLLGYIKKAGLVFDQTVLDRGIKYITVAAQHDRWPSWYGAKEKLTTKTFIVAVLAELGRPVEPLVETLYEQREKMSPFELALLLKTLGHAGRGSQQSRQIEEVSRRLFNQAIMASGEVHFEEKTGLAGLMASPARTNALVLRALVQTSPESPHLVPLARWLVKASRDGHWGSTQANAMVLLALTEYLRAMEENPPSCRLEAVLDGRIIGQAVFESFNDPPAEKKISLKDLPQGVKIPLEIKYQGQGATYYTLRLAYSRQQPDLEDYQAGLTLSRIYSLAETNTGRPQPTTTFKRGDIVRIDVTMLVPATRNWVVLQDWLPAGLEPLNFDLPVAPKHLQNLLSGPHKPGDYYLRYWYEHREIRGDRVAVYARVLKEGVYTFSYLARAVTPGRFVAPGPEAEEMYSPETSGKGQGVWLEIK